jgi:endonuclease/exonuclease/phosphatase family metal-dependent hydrolase
MIQISYILIIYLAIFLNSAPAHSKLTGAIGESSFFTYQELQELSKSFELRPELKNKLKGVFNNPINGQTKFEAQTKLKNHLRIQRKYFRVIHWNLERGHRLKDLDRALNQTTQYIKDSQDPKRDLDKELFITEANLFKETDIYTLNEADFGMQRTDYKNTVEEFAKITKSNYYTFVPEFIEIDSKYLDHKGLDKNRIKAMHGNAIVSKFPIKYTKVIELPVCYDWFNGEQKRVTLLEKVKRRTSRLLFDVPIFTELRRGHRNALVARIDLPESQEDLTVIVTHFENRTRPKCRKYQLQHLLDEIKDINTPLILSGDFNNTEVSAEPTSVNSVIFRTVTDWQNLARATVSWVNPASYLTNPILLGVNTLRKAHDPTVIGLPLFLRNKTADIFWKLINFDFSDKNMFDFSGNKELSYNGKGGKLSNSNQRITKGFASTFRLMNHNPLTHFRLDWIFVKSLRIAGCQDREDDFEDIKPECKRFIPAFARNLSELNDSYFRNFTNEVEDNKNRDFSLDKLSDHDPISCEILL